MKLIIKVCLLLISSLTLSVLYAMPHTCPPPDQIKSVIFERTIVYDSENDIWELLSIPFVHEGMTWNVLYGTELPGVKDPQLVLERGQANYVTAALRHQHPQPDAIPGHLFCDYTSPGMEYWIQALSPPGE